MNTTSAKRLALGYAAASAVVLAATLGSATEVPVPVQTLENIAASIDATNDGVVAAAEHRDFTEVAFLSMDSDESYTIDGDEFFAWDMGFAHLADERGKASAYAQAKLDVFAVWDGDGDGVISSAEAREQALWEFTNADADGDGQVNARDLAIGSPTFATLLSVVWA